MSVTTLATTRTGANEEVSAVQPIKYVEMMVPIPAPVPLKPLTLTEATTRLGYRSDGNASAIVDQAAYANVEIANNPS